MYFTEYLENGGTLIAGLSYEQNQLIHDTLSFARNVMDHDGDAFEPWYPDGRLHSVNLSVRYDQPLLSWMRLQAEGYNSVLHFRPMKTEWTNDLYAQSIDDLTQTPLYTYHWSSEAFSGGILENEAKVIAEHNPVNGLNLYGHVGVSLDGIILGGGKTIVTPNWLAKVAMSYEPVWWFRFGLSVSHHRMSYTWDEMRYLSNAYMNGEIRYADNTLLATTGGFNHRIDKNLWKHQASYAVVDLPITFTFGKSHRHQIELLNSYRVYYNQWFTQFTDGVEANMTKVDDVWYYTPGAKDYTLTTQPLDLLSSQPGALTPFYLSNTVRYTYTGRKWFVQLSWQSFMQSGFSTLGNGPLHNNLGALSESTANPNTFTADREGSLPFQGNGRINQDKGFIARLQVTYNTCRYFSLGLNFKFKDGQPFTNFVTHTQQIEGQNQLVVLPIDARGTNPANNHFGKRKDAFFNLELRATGRWWANGVPMSLEAMCYNLYDFGTALTEYTFDENTSIPGRTTMSMCIPRGLLFTFRVGLEKDKDSL